MVCEGGAYQHHPLIPRLKRHLQRLMPAPRPTFYPRVRLRNPSEAKEALPTDAEAVVEQGEEETVTEVSSSAENVAPPEADEPTAIADEDAVSDSTDAEHTADATVKESSDTKADKPWAK